jgi:hypothetical protein
MSVPQPRPDPAESFLRPPERRWPLGWLMLLLMVLGAVALYHWRQSAAPLARPPAERAPGAPAQPHGAAAGRCARRAPRRPGARRRRGDALRAGRPHHLHRRPLPARRAAKRSAGAAQSEPGRWFSPAAGRCGPRAGRATAPGMGGPGRAMAKEELIEMHGIVNEVLPDSRYRVTLDNGHQLVAYSGRQAEEEPHPHPGRRQRVAGAVALRPEQGPHHLPPPGCRRR